MKKKREITSILFNSVCFYALTQCHPAALQTRIEETRIEHPRGMAMGTKRSPGQPTESPTRSRTRPRRSISDNDGLSKASPQRPRTPLNQTSRSQDSNMWSRSSQLISFLTPSRRGSQASPSFPRRGSNERHISRKPPSSPVMESDTDMDKDHDSGDDVQIVDIQQRRVPVSPQPRPRLGFRSGSGSSGRRR